MGGIFLRSMGAARAKVWVGLMNLTYNLKRIETLIRLKVFDFDRIGAPVAQAKAKKKGVTTQNSRHRLWGNKQTAVDVVSLTGTLSKNEI
ncbi:hypothetical protein NTGBS_360030 [Candidatus Nitrotoga sp. BS]|uniref:hypothetical protein n=1 Tax=Candidatus Nitrotoga sp. BS TaxID=2890408 RepID=UPI001EF23DBC|nr:hypothetical protein [Candidatus Nitrotoga sp. BS]CAH1199439.1 hypothetical protein NTGBS_360030 [Candidatus Nitrotoga sp. BS]